MSADTLALLEEKILKTVETVNRLRKEKEAALAAASDTDQLRSQNRALEERNTDLSKELADLRSERDSLQSDKDAVRQRLEGLLKQIEALGA
jgi:FtsZ-binding cell division protein ZapB